jgi:hypothetical protein
MQQRSIRRFLFTCAITALLPTFVEAHAASPDRTLNAEPVLWGSNQKSATWAEELLGQVVTYQTLSDKGVIPGNYQPYLEQMAKVRELHRTGNRRATYDGVNEFMVMLEARVGGIDGHSADAIWDFCYRVTPDEFHARDRHVKAKGGDEIKRWEEMMRDMEERAGMAF